MKISPLYPVLDADTLGEPVAHGALPDVLCARAMAFADLGCSTLQLRARKLGAPVLLSCVRELRRRLPKVTLILDGRADLALAAAFDGIHLGQGDLSPQGARVLLGIGRLVGISADDAEQFSNALAEPVDYVVVGAKDEGGAAVRNDTLAMARRLLDASNRELSLVVYGCIAADDVESARKAGADCVAVEVDVSGSPLEAAREFFRLML
jgi:thiamine-phosphate pyrophosphorylase